MIIQTERLKLRAFAAQDISWYFDLLQEDDVRNTFKGLYVDNKEEAKKDIEIFNKCDFENDFYYVITDKNTNTFIGFIIAVRIVSRIIDVSCYLYPKYRHNGYMNEALSALINSARRINPAYAFRLVINKQNDNSIKLAEKLNAVLILTKETEYHYYL